MPYLIDGYNLLHAMGVLRGRTGPHGLEKARLGLLGLLHGTYRDDVSSIVVVFDAAGAIPGAAEESEYDGIRVHFAVHQQQADDLIESMIEHDSAPRRLTVVSDDRRIQQAARRRQCTALSCLDFLEELQHRRRLGRIQSGEDPEKKETLSKHETQRWLSEFADLADDPAVKELFDPFGFEERQD